MRGDTPTGRSLRDHFFRSEGAGTYLKTGGMWYGLIFGLSYALVLWGRYAYQIWPTSVSFPWLEITVGTFLFVVVWVVMGYLSSLRRSVVWVAILGALAAVITPWMVWLAQTINENIVWFANRQDWSFVAHFGEALQLRLLFVGFWGIGIGVFAGLLARWLIPRAWDLTTASGRTSLKSLGLFLLCVPLTFLFASITSDMLHKDYLESLSGTYESISSFDPEETRRPFLTWRYGDKKIESNVSWDWPTGDFVLHLVDYNAETMDQYFFDAVYVDGSTVRCQGGSSSMQLCGNVSDTLSQMMAGMIRSGMDRELEELRCQMCDPYIQAEVLTSLSRLRTNFTGNYDIHKTNQHGGAVSMKARFDSGYELTCRFRGEDPIIVESCTGQSEP